MWSPRSSRKGAADGERQKVCGAPFLEDAHRRTRVGKPSPISMTLYSYTTLLDFIIVKFDTIQLRFYILYGKIMESRNGSDYNYT